MDNLGQLYIITVRLYTLLCFLARDTIYAIARYMSSPVRLAVCASHGWISQRRLKLGSRNLHHRVMTSFLTLNFTVLFQREVSERRRRIRQGYEKYAIFCQVPVLYSHSPGGATIFSSCRYCITFHHGALWRAALGVSKAFLSALLFSWSVQGKGQNPLHQFPRSNVCNKLAGQKSAVSVVSCRFPNSIITTC